MKTKRQKICHCCGIYTEPQAQDPDRDKGYGTCKKCSTQIALDNEERWKGVIALVAKSLNPENRAKFLSEHIAVQAHICDEMIKAGIISWKFS